jgi:hypothetical protein
MGKDSDTRTLDRHQIPKARVYYRKIKSINIFKRFKGPYSLTDISKSSVKFEHSSISLEQVPVELKIIVPDSYNLKIKGKIAGPLDSKNYHRDNTIVHFLPFGNRKVYNTYRSKNKLELILEEYASKK